MAGFPYFVDFGSANAGGTPTWLVFKDAATLSALTQPSITEVGSGVYSFSWDWSSSSTQTILYVMTLNGLEQFGTVSGVPPAGQAVGTVATAANTSGYATAGTIISRAAVQLGIAAYPGWTDPWAIAATNPDAGLLIDQLTTLGDDLTMRADWTHLVNGCTLTTVGTNTLYNLPSDFHEMCDQSGWNSSMRLPMIGPLTPQEVEYLVVRLNNILIQVAFRLKGNQIEFPVAPAAGQVVVFQYLSMNWVIPVGSNTYSASVPGQAGDYCGLDDELLIAGLKYNWAVTRGRDTTLLLERYNAKLEHAIGKNAGARAIRMGGVSIGEHFLDVTNLPVTGYGS
jgi:hypothetical protein